MWAYMIIAVVAWGAFLLVVAGIARLTDRQFLRRRRYATTLAKMGGSGIAMGLLGVLCGWLAWKAWGVSDNWAASFAALVLSILFLGSFLGGFWAGLVALVTGRDFTVKKPPAEIPAGAKAETEEERITRELAVDSNTNEWNDLAAIAARTLPDEAGRRVVRVSLAPRKVSGSWFVSVVIGDKKVGSLQHSLCHRVWPPLNKRGDKPPLTWPAELKQVPNGYWVVQLLEMPSPKEIKQAL